MFCKNHDVVGCSTCMLGKHSSCEDKLYIPEFINDNTKATNSDTVEEKLESITQSLNALQELFALEVEELKCNKDKVLKEIGTFRDKMNQLLNQFEKNIVHQLEHRFKSLTDKIDSSLHDLQATISEIKAAQDNLKSAGGNMPQKFVVIMQANQVVANAEEKVEIKERKFSHSEVYFLSNKKLQTLFSEIQDLGSIKVRKRLRITGKQTYPVNVFDSFKCNISSACSLNDDAIILADYNHCNLKRLDPSSNIITDCCGVPFRPWQACAITDTEVAVSCNQSNLIQFVGRTMKKTRQIKTGFICQGLAYACERLFVSNEDSVYMFSLSGERLQQIYKYQPGQRLFCDIWALAVNRDKSTIYVADRNQGLIILVTNGHFVGQYNGNKLNGACGICLNNNDNVLVCGLYSRNVLQFSPDGKLIAEVLKTDGYCNTVCCYKNNSKLMVGFEETNEIEVYDINAETLL